MVTLSASAIYSESVRGQLTIKDAADLAHLTIDQESVLVCRRHVITPEKPDGR